MVVSRGVVFDGNFLDSVDGGRSKVALRVSREFRREILGPGLSPFSILAIITLVGWMCKV